MSGPWHGTARAHHGGQGGGFPYLSRGRPPNPNVLRTGASVFALCSVLLFIDDYRTFFMYFF